MLQIAIRTEFQDHSDVVLCQEAIVYFSRKHSVRISAEGKLPQNANLAVYNRIWIYWWFPWFYFRIFWWGWVEGFWRQWPGEFWLWYPCKLWRTHPRRWNQHPGTRINRSSKPLSSYRKESWNGLIYFVYFLMIISSPFYIKKSIRILSPIWKSYNNWSL